MMMWMWTDCMVAARRFVRGIPTWAFPAVAVACVAAILVFAPMSNPVVRRVVGWLMLGGFTFLVGVGVWAITTIEGMKRDQAIAIATLNTIAERAVLISALTDLKAKASLANGEKRNGPS